MSNWLDVAKSLPQGGKVRIPCCKLDNSMLVSHNPTGYSCYCFRCGAHEFEPHGERRIADILRHKAELQYMQQRNVILPEDYTLDVPLDKAMWYMKVGISPELARQYRIGYSPSFDRIVLPVYEDDKLTALQMRACTDEQKPKYLNPTGPAVSGAVYWSQSPENGIGVVTEDILSAIKVGRVLNAASILGTNMTDTRAMKIAKRWKDGVVLWLDPDKAGKKGAVEAARQLQMQGCRVAKIVSERDPKYYNLSQIKELIRSARFD